MPNWKEVLEEIQAAAIEEQQKAKEEGRLPNNVLDMVRFKYLNRISSITGRNVIAYYSSFLQKPKYANASGITDLDKSAFMTTIHNLDREKGLDLILHTPGGDLAAAESLIDYLHKMFDNDIRAIVPQISMSAGTMIALSCKSIMMGKQSNLGPIDPQMGGLPCQGIVEEFEKACEQVIDNPSIAPIWQSIIEKYHPTLLSELKTTEKHLK